MAPHASAPVEKFVAQTRRIHRRLYTSKAMRPGQRLRRRFLWALGVFSAVLGVLWLDREGLSDEHDGYVSFIDVLYFTFVTITTVGYGDIVPITDRARLIDAIFVTPARLVFIMIFVGTAYELVIQRWVEGIRMARLQAKLHGHIIICGFGAVGQMAARELLARGIPPEQIVVIDRGEEALEGAADLKLTGLRGDATRADVLADAATPRARGVIVCAGTDAVNALISLAVREQTSARLVIAAAGLDTRRVLKHSGADAVISPPALGGYVLADALESPPVADMLVDILSAHGEAEWRELDVEAQQVGRHPRSVENCVVIAVRRGSRLFWPWQPDAQRLEEGDRLIVVRATTAGGSSLSRS